MNDTAAVAPLTGITGPHLGPLDLLNLIAFGLAVVSFLFGIWSHFKLRKVEALRDNTVAVIRNLAATAAHNTNDISVRGYLDGIILSSNVLAKGQTIGLGDSATAVEFIYDPTQPPFHSQGYPIIDDPRAANGKAIAGSRSADGHTFLVYGPYVSLGCTGHFLVEFRLRLDDSSTKPDPGADVASIDVFCQAEHRWLVYRTVLGRELSIEYRPFALQFLNDAATRSLEFRVQLLAAGPRVLCDRIVVRRTTSGLDERDLG